MSAGILSTDPFRRGGKTQLTSLGSGTRQKRGRSQRAGDTSSGLRAYDTPSVTVDPVQKAAIAREIRNLQNDMPSIVHQYLGLRLFSDKEIINITEGHIIDGVVSGGTVIEKTKSEYDLNTLSDPRMGPENPNKMCTLCKGTNCVGHYGRIDFVRPIYHPMYLSNTNSSIYKLMSCICPTCGNLYADKEWVTRTGLDKYRGLARLTAVSKPPKKVCRFYDKEGYGGCSEPVTFRPKPSKELGTVIYTRGKDPTELRIDASVALKLLTGLSDREIDELRSSGIYTEEEIRKMSGFTSDDARLLGFTDNSVPIRFIIHRMLVPPPKTRIAKNSNGTQVPNILTIHLDKIIEANNRLKLADGGTQVAGNVSAAIRVLYAEVKEYMSVVGSNIQGKDKMIRGQMSAKRGDFCSRMVITPEDGIEVGQVVVPADVVASLTPTETVTSENKEYIQDLMDQGCVTYYTRFVGEDEGVTRQPQPGVTKIEIGDEVERWLEDGDYVIVLRPPNLHKQNIFAVRAVIEPNRSTLGIHLSYATGLHGDFDGDEMIVWAVLGSKERFEAEYIMDIRRNMMATLNPYPIVAPIYDTIIGCYLMTEDNTIVDDEIFDYCWSILMERDQLDTYKLRMSIAGLNPKSGRALFSMLLPSDLEYRSGNVGISSGILLRGSITVKQISTKARSIVHDIHIVYGWERAANFVTDVTRCTRAFLDQYGFSVGYKDFLFGDTEMARGMVRKVLMDAEIKAGLIPMNDRNRERKMNEIIGKVMDVKNKIYDLMDEGNRIKKMSSDQSGAKGSMDNALLGAGTPIQIMYRGERLKPELAGGTRVTPHHRKGTRETLASRGLTTISYLRGVSPDTMFDHFRSVRIGQAQIASGTPKVGTIQRRIAKLMENARTGLLGDTNIGDFRLQQLYGGDGFETSKLVPIGNEVSFVDVGVLFDMYNAERGWVGEKSAPLSYFESSSIGEMQIKVFNSYTRDWRINVLKGIVMEYDPPEYPVEDPVTSEYRSEIGQWHGEYEAEREKMIEDGIIDPSEQTESDEKQRVLEYLNMHPLPSLTEIQKSVEEAGLIEKRVLERENEMDVEYDAREETPLELGDVEAELCIDDGEC